MMVSEAKKFKVGDKVRLTERYGRHPIGTEGVVNDVLGGADDDDLVYTDTVSGVYAKRLELVPAVSEWQPKVGDLVRFTTKTPSYCAAHTTADLTIRRLDKNSSGGIDAFVGGYPNVSGDYDQVVRLSDIEPAPAALTIEAGKFYKTRDGRKVGPMYFSDFGDDQPWSDGSRWYSNDGSWRGDSQEDERDLIAEWVDEPAPIANDNAAPAKFKVGDRVRVRITGNEYTITGVKVPWLADGKICYYASGAGLSGGTYWAEHLDLVSPSTTPKPTAIVALIEDGQPKPNTRPYVHATEEAAKREADRLAGVHKGQQFGVYVLTAISQESAPVYKHEWQRLAAEGKKINAIKELRSLTGMQLRQAKDVVEHFVDYPYGAAA